MTKQPSSSVAPQHDGVIKRILKNVAMLFSSKATAAIIGLIVLGVAARALGLETLGSLLLLHAYVTLISGIATFKSWQAIILYGSDPLKNSDKSKIHTLLRFTISLDLIAAVAGALISLSFFPLIRQHLGLPEEALIPGFLYCILTIFDLRSSPLGVLRLLDRFDLISLHSLIVPLIRLTGSVIGLIAGFDLLWFIGVWFAANAVSYLALPLLALRELHRQDLLQDLFSSRLSLKAPQKGIWRFVWISNLDATIDLADNHIATLLSGVLLGPGFAAMFKIARDMSDVLAKGARLLDQAIYPELVKMILSGNTARVAQIIVRTSLIMLCAGAVMGLIAHFFGPAFFKFAFTDASSGVAAVATPLMIAAGIFAATTPLYATFYALEKPALTMMIRSFAVSTIIILFIVLAKTIGTSGPGIAMIVGQFAGFSLAAWLTFANLRVKLSPVATDKKSPTP